MTAANLDPRYLERLLEVGRTLVSEHELDAVLARVLEAAVELTGARYAAVGVLNADGSELDRFLTTGIDEETRRAIGELPHGYGILGELIREPRPLRLERIGDHPRSYGFPAGHPPMETFLGVPVRIRAEVYGNLYLTDKQGGDGFTEEDERLLIVLSEWAAIAIDHARSHEAEASRRTGLERALRALEATVFLSREVGAETDLERVLELVVKRARALVAARSAAVILLGEDRELAIAAVAGELDQRLRGRPMAEAGAVAHDVVRAGRSQRVEGAAARRLTAAGIETEVAMIVPLISRGRELGVLAVFDPEEPYGAFSADDQLALESFATGAGHAIAATQAIEDEKLRLSIASSERERRRWARELHDETLQELGALKVMHESALRLDDQQALREALVRSDEQVGRVIAGLHGLITELRPAALDQLGPGAAVEALIERLRERSGLEIDLDVDLDYESGREVSRHPPEVEATIYRTVQEALNNVVKHAGAGRARVLIEERDGRIRVTVEDDGRGFDGESGGDGFGLLGMRERIALAGGSLRITTPTGGGTRVSAEVPARLVDQG